MVAGERGSGGLCPTARGRADMSTDIASAGAGSRESADAPPVEGAGFHYWAFISYSQRDAEWAKRLHEFLETYRIPRALVGRPVSGRTIPPRLMPVFRDRDELAGNPD